MLKVLTIIITLFISQLSFATKPCMSPTEQWVIENVINNTSIVVYAEIRNDSKRTHDNHSQSPDDYWTDIKIIKSLHGNPNKKSLRIMAFQAYSYPIYAYKKGQRAIFFLKKKNDKYKLTDHSWKHCIPSIIEEFDEGKFSLPHSDNQMSLDDISKSIQSLFAKSL